MPVTEERASKAITEACTALRRRKAVEEGAHASMIATLKKALTNQGGELHEKVESLERELSQSYRAQALISEQLVHEMKSSQELRTQLTEKEALAAELQSQLDIARTQVQELEASLQEKTSALDLAVEELIRMRTRVNELEASLLEVQAENKELVDRWMMQKMQDAERLNEANAMYADMMERFKSNSLAELARQQVDGIVRHSEAGAESYMKMSTPPKSVRHTNVAHEGGVTALSYEHHSDVLVSAGYDCTVKFWDISRGISTRSLHGCVGCVLDFALTTDNTLLLGGCSDNKIYLWDVHSGRIRHTLTGHTEKVPAVGMSKGNNRRAVSAGYDRTIKTWDLHTGYVMNTMMCHSNCNSLCLTADGAVICTGHVDGNLRFWDCRTGKLCNEVAAHAQCITSVAISRLGSIVVTVGRDNVVNVFDVRMCEVRCTLRAAGLKVASNWSRVCMSGDESYVATGSNDGCVYVWNRVTGEVEATLTGHNSPVITCAWSDVRKSLSTADKNGTLCMWE